jgi:hypothetical protein
MGLQRTRQQNHTIESIRDAMTDLREAYPNAGAREMVSLLFHEKDMSVSRYVICFSLTGCEFDQQSQECGHFILCRCRDSYFYGRVMGIFTQAVRLSFA